MQNSEFEKNVQQKMDDLKFVPADAVWEKIEAALPEKERSRRWIFFILFFIGLITASVLVWNKFNDNDKHTNIATQQKAAKENVVTTNPSTPILTQDTLPGNAATGTKNTAGNNKEGIQKEKITVTISTNDNLAQQVKQNKYSKVKKGRSMLSSGSFDEFLAKKDNKKFSTKSGTTIKVKKPAAAAEEDNETATELTADAVKMPVENSIATDSVIIDIKKAATDSVAIIKTDTTKNETNKSKKQKVRKKWLYGIDVAMGRSNVKSNLFKTEPVYAAMANYSASPGGGGSAAINMPPNDPSAGKAIAAGFYIEKMIHPKWSVKTGLNYMYQSNTVKTGQKVDSSIRYNFSMLGTSLYADNYYRAGNTVNHTNAFHFLELPLMLQFKVNSKLPLYVEAGPTVSWLMNSNALIYNNNTATYFSSDNMFNKLLFSLKAGAGFDIAKRSKIPFSIGYQFKYSINSVIKTNLAKQHFINSLIYVKVPLKK